MEIKNYQYTKSFKGHMGTVEKELAKKVLKYMPTPYQHGMEEAIETGIAKLPKVVKNIGPDELEFSIARSELDGLMVTCQLNEEGHTRTIFDKLNPKRQEGYGFVPKCSIYTDFRSTIDTSNHLSSRIIELTSIIERRKTLKLPTENLERQRNELESYYTKFCDQETHYLDSEVLRRYLLGQAIGNRLIAAAKEGMAKLYQRYGLGAICPK